MSDLSLDTSFILFHCISFHLLCLAAPHSSSPPFSYNTPSKDKHRLTEHVNSFSRSPCTPLDRSLSAIAIRLSKLPGSKALMLVVVLAVTS